jgi:hypothetical protein
MTEQHADKTYQRKSGHPESNQGPSDVCRIYSQMLYQLSYSRSWQSLWHGIGEHPFCPWGIVVKILQVLWVSGLSVEETSRRMLQGGTQQMQQVHRTSQPQKDTWTGTRTRTTGPEPDQSQRTRGPEPAAIPKMLQNSSPRQPPGKAPTRARERPLCLLGHNC